MKTIELIREYEIDGTEVKQKNTTGMLIRCMDCIHKRDDMCYRTPHPITVNDYGYCSWRDRKLGENQYDGKRFNQEVIR